jgi:drug/metabolite transporter (DMT)-like permease
VFVPRFGLPRGAIVVAVELIGGGAALLAISLAAGETWPAEVSTRSILALAYLIVCGSWVAFTAYDWLIRNVRPAVATSYAYVNPLVAVALGVGLAGETMEPAALTAGVLIVASVAVINLSALLRRRR